MDPSGLKTQDARSFRRAEDPMDDTTAPPPVLDMARVIAYAIVDSSAIWTGRQTLFVGNQLLGAVPRLALCQNLKEGDTDILLFHCDSNWHVLGAIGAPTIEEAKARAERAYKGISEKWIHKDTTPEEARSWIREQDPNMICSFCDRLPMEVDCLVEGDDAAICSDCIKHLYKNLKT
jgi:hypothetical protein